MAIPKIIHYCWYGKGEFTPMMKECIASWKKFCPDYQIIEWNEENSDFENCAYAAAAYKNKKWAFVSDYMRYKAVYEYGGIYLDTDVKLLKSLDPLIEHKGFMGWEEGAVANGLGFGAEPYNEIIKKCMESYYDLPAYRKDGQFNVVIQPGLTTEILVRYGLKREENIIQNINGFVIYPREYFCPLDIRLNKTRITPNSYSIHYYSASWYTKEQLKERKILTRRRRLERIIGKRLYHAWEIIRGLLFEGGFKSILNKYFRKN